MHQLQPEKEESQKCSPRAQIKREMTEGTYEALKERRVQTGVELVEGKGHICNLSSEPESEGWRTTRKGYEFLFGFV
jgi:hypothetical protein